jgi:type II secretory pathway pseudopilin PulG
VTNDETGILSAQVVPKLVAFSKFRKRLENEMEQANKFLRLLLSARE